MDYQQVMMGECLRNGRNWTESLGNGQFGVTRRWYCVGICFAWVNGMITNQEVKEQWQAHKEAVEEPLSFEVFERKYRLLMVMLARDPNGNDRSLDKRIKELCEQMGY